jgi:hypothetical protein
MTVEVIQLSQVVPIEMVATMKGMATPSISSIMTMSFFGSEDMRNNVDVTIILGNFTIDVNEHPNYSSFIFLTCLQTITSQSKQGINWIEIFITS